MGAARPTDDELTSAYRESGSIYDVGRRFGVRPQWVHKRLAPLGVVKPMNVWTSAEDDRLRAQYALYAKIGKLGDLAKAMGRTRHFLCRKARELGLTDPSRPKPWLAVWKGMAQETAASILDDFKQCRGTMAEYCVRRGFDDLGFSRTMKEHFPDEWEAVIESKAPRGTMYRRGRALEYRVRDELKANGFPLVMRSPQSKGKIDVLAVRPGCIVFVQCKRGGFVAVGEWNAIYDLAGACGAIPVVASCPTGRGTTYMRMTGRKDGSRSRQPFEPWTFP